MPQHPIPQPLQSYFEKPTIVLLAFSHEFEKAKEKVAVVQAAVPSCQIRLLSLRVEKAPGDKPFSVDDIAHSELDISQPLRSDKVFLEVLKAMDYDGSPCAFLHIDCVAAEQWARRLANIALRVGQEDRGSCVVSAMSLRHPLFSILNSNAQLPPADYSILEMDQWLNEFSEGQLIDVPGINPSASFFYCPNIKSYLENSQDDWELFQQLKASGPLLASSTVMVDDRAVDEELLSVEHIPPSYVSAVLSHHPLASIQHSLSELFSRAEMPAFIHDVKPVCLHIAHSWGGGLGRWVSDYINADEKQRNLVLRPIGSWEAFGQTLALYRGPEMDKPLKTWALSEWIQSTAIEHNQYREILDEIIRDYQVESIMLSSLIGQSLQSLRTDLPTTVVLHDYYPYCPALVARFESPCSQCDSSRQKDCRQNNSLHKYFHHVSDLHWDTLRLSYEECLLQDNIKLVAPSQSVKQQMLQLIPGLAKKNIHLIEHGLPQAQVDSFRQQEWSRQSDKEKLDIVILGSLAEIKGEKLLREAHKDILKYANLHLLGCGDSGQAYQNIPGIQIVERYESKDLAALLKDIQPDLGLLLSIVPETFSYTLSECWAASIPVIACRIGAFADRIEDGKNGYLIDLQASALLQKIEYCANNPEELRQISVNLRQNEQRLCRHMCQDYYALWPDQIDYYQRYFLPRKSYRNPYANSDQEKNGALYIDRQQSYKAVLGDFLRYTQQKLSQSPSVGRVFSAVAIKSISLLIKILKV